MATIVTSTTTTTSQRRATVPADNPSVEYPSTQTIPPAVDGLIHYIRQGDIIDVGMIWKPWLDANDGTILTSAWAAHANSPQAPTFGADGIDVALGATVTQLDTSAAAIGDTYYLQNTITVSDTTAGTVNTYDLPTRTLIRVMHVRITI